jgi:hypothetical protein
MDIINEREIIDQRDVKVVDLQPSACTIDPEKKKINANENITIRLLDFVEPNGLDLRPEEKIMVKVEEGKILNGSKHGAYTVFPIGGGTVNVAYEAPDVCGLDKDFMTVFNVCEDQGKGILQPNEKIAEQTIQIKKVACDVSVNIKAAFQWKDDTKHHHIQGYASMTVQGAMTFDQRYQAPMVKRYTPGKMTAGWSYKETLRDLDPGDCPELIQEYRGSGTTAIPMPQFKESSYLELRKFGEIFQDMETPIPIPSEAKEQMTDQFIFVLPAARQKIKGRIRRSCREYENKEREIGVGSIVITGKIKPDGTLSGSHNWTGQGSAMDTLGFQVNEISRKVQFRPPLLKKIEDKLINVSVNWDIKVNK